MPRMSKPNKVQETAFTVTKWVGSPASIILHSLLFIASFALAFFHIVSFDRMLLVLTTIVSLEAIYLAIFIQMTLNFTSETIVEVEKDIDEIQEDIDEMQEDVEEIQEDVEEISEDVDELQEDIEEIEEDGDADAARKLAQKQALESIQSDLKRLMEDISKLQGK